MTERAKPLLRQQVAGAVLVIPFSELGTKSGASRAKMMDQLLTNAKHVLKDVFHVAWDKYRMLGERLVFLFSKEDVGRAMDALQHVPGILRLYACVETQPRAQAISRKVAELVDRGALVFDGSAVEVRAPFFDEKRQKEELVEGVLAALSEGARPRGGGAGPSTGTYIELHPAFAYVALERRDGLNGNPVGTQNPVVAEIVGRGGDLLASLLAIKRGIVLTPVFFSIGEFAADQARYKDMLAGIKRGIDLFHGFPVKRYFFVPFGEILSYLRDKRPLLMEVHPCACCIVARRAIMQTIIKRNSMTGFIIQGAARVPAALHVDSCPFEASVDQATNPDGLFLVNPLLTGTQELPTPFKDQLERLAEPADENKGFTWSFCKLRASDQAGIVAWECMADVQDLVRRLARDRQDDLVVPVDDELPFRDSTRAGGR